MPDPTPEAPPQEPAKKKPYEYKLPFEAVGEFTDVELFVKGFVRGKLHLSEKLNVVFHSLTGEQVDAINAGVKVTPEMTITHFQTEQTYHNLAHSIESVGGTAFEGTFDEKLLKVRKMGGPLLMRLSQAYLEFGHHVDDLFVEKGGLDTAKKS